MDRELLVAKANEIFSQRKARARHFNNTMFGEPAWDMLLALYIADHSETRLTVTEITELAGSKRTSALRWLTYLHDEQLVLRRQCPSDRRSVVIEISEGGRQALDSLLGEVITGVS